MLAHGAPERLEDIPEFLLHVRGGRKLPDAAVEEVIRRYARVGGGSPLLKLTCRQASALAERLKLPVYVGMRNWKPFIADTVRTISQDGLDQVIALCLAPQNSRTSTGLYYKHLREAVEKFAPRLQVEFVESWHDAPLLIEAFREKIALALARAESEAAGPVPVIFSAHSVPVRTIAEGDPYESQVRETATRVAEALGLTNYCVAFQSQGMTAEPWLGPTVESQIDRFAAAGTRRLLIAPVGFVSDHVEILHDIDVVFRGHGESRGVKVWRSESLNDSPLFIEALASIVREQLGREQGTP